MQYSDVIVTDCIHMKLVGKVASFLRLQDFQELQILKSCIFFVTSSSFVPGFHSGFLYLCKRKSVLRPGKKAKANMTLKSTCTNRIIILRPCLGARPSSSPCEGYGIETAC